MNQLFYNIFTGKAVVLADDAAKIFSSRHLLAGVISVCNGSMKHARATEFDYTNLPATVDSQELEPSRKIEKASSYRELELTRVKLYRNDLKGNEK